MRADNILRHFRHRSLDAFRAVYETRSVTRAAARLGLSQPAVSQLLGGLERAVGVALFDRGAGRRLTPTEEGHAFRDEAYRTIEAMERLEATAADLRRRAGARLRIWAAPALAHGFVPEVIDRFTRQSPEVQIALEADAPRTAETRLADGDFDLSLSFQPASRAELESRLLFDVAAIVAMPVDHPLAAADVLRPRDLVGERLVLTAPGTTLRARVESLFAADGARIDRSVEAPAESSLCRVAVESAAIAIVNPCIAHYQEEGLALRVLQPTLGCPVRLQRRRGGGRSPLADAFAAEAVRLSETIAASIAASSRGGNA